MEYNKNINFGIVKANLKRRKYFQFGAFRETYIGNAIVIRTQGTKDKNKHNRKIKLHQMIMVWYKLNIMIFFIKFAHMRVGITRAIPLYLYCHLM